MNRIVLLLALAPALAVLWAGCSKAAEDVPSRPDVPLKAQPSFKEDVQPVLETYCVKCHQAQDAHGGLRMDNYDTLMQGSYTGHIVLPGNPEFSLLLRVIRRETDPVLWMPFHQEPLTPNRIRNLENWVRNGAPNN